MRHLPLFFLFISTSIFAQSVQIKPYQLAIELREAMAEPTPEKLLFPIIHSGDDNIDTIINTDLKNRFTNNESPNANLESTLKQWANNQVTSLGYTVTFNQNNLLSLNISSEWCSAYCIFTTDYFNYSIVRGEWLDISQVIDIKSFKPIVYADAKIQFAQQRQALIEQMNTPEEQQYSADYQAALEYYQQCEDNFSLNTFALYPDRLEIIADCYFPYGIHMFAPTIDLTYQYADIAEYLKIKD